MSAGATPPTANVDVDENTKLSDLTDQQRMELAQKVKDEHALSTPLVGEVEPISSLQAEYENSLFVRKVAWLEKYGQFRGLRRLRGDGDCFYRAFAFAYVQALMLANSPDVVQAARTHLEDTFPLLQQAGFDKMVYEDFYDELRNLISSFPSGSSLDNDFLLKAFNNPETSNSIVVFLRLVTSAFLRAHSDEYTPFLFALDELPGSVQGMEDFCSSQVEAVGREADHLQITALTRAMKCGLSVAYLSAAPGEIVDIVQFEPADGEMLNLGTALFRPGHYDLLVK